MNFYNIRLVFGVLSCLFAYTTYANNKIPVIVIADIYHPGQDAGDNFDLITPYALPEIDLIGVIFDVTDKYRKEVGTDGIAREPGYIPIIQLNYIFNKNVPTACSPFIPMRSSQDKMTDLPAFQQQGVKLFLNLLRKSKRKIEVVSTGSARLLAVAYNQNPKLMQKKIRNIHFCAGSSSAQFREWNIELDTLAAYRLLSSKLPINIYPCATKDGPFDLGKYNTFWALDDLSFIFEMNPLLQNYLAYSLLRKNKTDYLNYLEKPINQDDINSLKSYDIGKYYGSGGKHYIWETAVWENVSGRKLIKRKNGEILLVLKKEIETDDIIFQEEMKNCTVDISENGLFSFQLTTHKTNFKIYFRSNPKENEQLLRKALPQLYKSYKPYY